MDEKAFAANIREGQEHEGWARELSTDYVNLARTYDLLEQGGDTKGLGHYLVLARNFSRADFFQGENSPNLPRFFLRLYILSVYGRIQSLQQIIDDWRQLNCGNSFSDFYDFVFALEFTYASSN